MPTLGSALEEATRRLHAAGSETARLDAELLLALAIGTDRTGVLAHPEVELSPGQAARLEEALARRITGEPIAYIRGIKEFFGIVLGVDRRVLIPRPETELLVELGLARLRESLSAAPRPAGSPPLRAADVATGSGAVAVALAVSLRRRGQLGEVDILATDVSGDALQVAVENAVGHGVADRVRFRAGDLLPEDEPPFDVVLANLPYVPSAEVPLLPVAASFEPRLSLDGGRDGLDPLRRLIRSLPERLVPGGLALCEIDPRQADAVQAEVAGIAGTTGTTVTTGTEGTAGMAGSTGAVGFAEGWSSTVHPDLSGRARVVEIVRGARRDAAGAADGGQGSHADGAAADGGQGSHADGAAADGGQGSHADGAAADGGQGSHADGAAADGGQGSHADGTSADRDQGAHADGPSPERAQRVHAAPES